MKMLKKTLAESESAYFRSSKMMQIKIMKTLPVVVLKRLDNTPTPAKRGRGRPPKKIEDNEKTEEVLKEIEEDPKKLGQNEEDDFNSEELRNNFLLSLDSDEDGDDEEGDSDKENSTPKWKPITGKIQKPQVKFEGFGHNHVVRASNGIMV